MGTANDYYVCSPLKSRIIASLALRKMDLIATILILCLIGGGMAFDDYDDCLLDCERYPPGAAQKNCQKHCIIFGSNKGSKKFKRDAECLHDCDDLPPGQRAPCRADCFRRNSQVKRSWITECLHDCDDLPQGHRAPCRADCMRGYKVKRSWISECLHDCEDLPKGQRAPCRADCMRG